jgi:hypothetical protein
VHISCVAHRYHTIAPYTHQMPASRDLAHLLAVMRPALDPREFVFASGSFDTLAELSRSGTVPLATFVETEGVSLVLERSVATRFDLAYIYPCRLITLTVHSSLDAIGFVARITSALAAAGISVNPIAAYHHDHLLVPSDRADEALAVLVALAARA